MNKILKLGRKPKREDARTLKFGKYFQILPPVPTSVDWSGKVPSWGMMANDAVGDCTCASAGHLDMLWTANASTEFVPTDTDILAAYSAITGYDPSQTDASGNNPTDTGADLLTVLKFWRSSGISARKISAFADVPPLNQQQVQAAIAFFGGLYAGVNLPQSAMDATNSGLVWDNASDPNILGGHAIPIVAYDATGLVCVTWGALQRMTWGWFNAYCDESFAVFSADWIGVNGVAPSGFNQAQLQSDLQNI